MLLTTLALVTGSVYASQRAFIAYQAADQLAALDAEQSLEGSEPVDASSVMSVDEAAAPNDDDDIDETASSSEFSDAPSFADAAPAIESEIDWHLRLSFIGLLLAVVGSAGVVLLSRHGIGLETR